MDIQKDCFVRLEYRLCLDNGEFIKGSEEHPAILTFVAGYNELLPSLEVRLMGLKENESREFVIPAAQAFGPHEPSQVQAWNRSCFPAEMKLHPGLRVTPANSLIPLDYPFIVTEVKENSVVLDMNHPLAGKDLHYSVRILEVRPATQEELEPRQKCQTCQDDILVG
ncbi:MAG: peptidylprolyl isomerase [Deltaproteobacteria bacterium]|nr:peptidylprolyl isomerase [Deltaproteobacteria bacterium]MBW1986986.1 peptidylprolyl isomerase [Deltaproteobacteria bacterium]MBW2134057.1 peptidylprolyl isomerase [Deltaproteobacteria bacterium]